MLELVGALFSELQTLRTLVVLLDDVVGENWDVSPCEAFSGNC